MKRFNIQFNWHITVGQKRDWLDVVGRREWQALDLVVVHQEDQRRRRKSDADAENRRRKAARRHLQQTKKSFYPIGCCLYEAYVKNSWVRILLRSTLTFKTRATEKKIRGWLNHCEDVISGLRAKRKFTSKSDSYRGPDTFQFLAC